MYNNQFYPYLHFPTVSTLQFPYKQPFHINWKSLLNNTQKTINVINQTAPLVYQLKPLYQNIKTMLKVKNILHDPDNQEIIKSSQKKDISSNEPIFFL